MNITWDPVSFMNLVFALVIMCLGAIAYKKRDVLLGAYLFMGFALFAVSWVITIFGYGDQTTILVIVRAVGYISIIIGLCIPLLERK
jgi:hypothetical protein